MTPDRPHPAWRLLLPLAPYAALLLTLSLALRPFGLAWLALPITAAAAAGVLLYASTCRRPPKR